MISLTQVAKIINTNDYHTNLPQAHADKSTIQDILTIVFAILGALAVLMIVIAGLRFITAQGNPQDVAKARNTIIYAVIGLIIAISAEAIVTLALGNLK
ncbi:MAG TPA: pilin [Candidatus Saccharimonadales bacterium]